MGGVLCRARGRIRGVALVAAMLLGVTGLAGASLPAAADAATVLLSATPDGAEGVGSYTASAPSLSRDGEHVAFASAAADLVEEDTNGAVDVFVRDRGEDGNWHTTLVSASALGQPANGGSYSPSISADGSVVAFASDAADLVIGDLNDLTDVFVWRQDPVTRLTSLLRVVTRLLGEPRGSSYQPSVSADGRVVAFASDAPNLVQGDDNDTIDVFVHDRATGATTLVSKGEGGKAADGPSFFPAVSAEGEQVAFVSMAADLGSADGAQPNVYVHDVDAGATKLVSEGAGGGPADSSSFSPAISADGRYVAFDSAAGNLVGGDADDGGEAVFVRDP